MDDCLDRGEHVLSAVVALAEQKADAVLVIAAFGDVGVGAEPVSDGSGFVADRVSARQEPAIAAVGTAQWEGIFSAFVLRQRLARSTWSGRWGRHDRRGGGARFRTW
ncbi:MAG: hypothetical protein ABI667_04105 [Sphingomicrobium sp.]